jgi:mono/diheme cytochrome c family protein
MNARPLVWLLAGALASAACEPNIARAPLGASAASPSDVVEFDRLYRMNCGGCHGVNGEGGVALGFNNPVYMAFADDHLLRRVTAEGVRGTGMPAFATASGGLLTDAQVDAVVAGIRARWGVSSGPATAVPPYRASRAGDPKRGAERFVDACAQCHGDDGRGGPQAGSIVEGSYLALVSDQSLRTTIIAGRPDLNHPGRDRLSGTALSDEDITDLVA